MPFLCILTFGEQHKWLDKLGTTYWYNVHTGLPSWHPIIQCGLLRLQHA